ncbi:hypothetical protein KFL_000160370 [Klebsormidium nitens]|uniref:SAND domain-containing protein n=1 Tax=Klebsormidium nitens TaxID=105231 RepID=A0A1Y1HJD7_KLENI|nr:hypothetical protein KFL_000160370 [Klebsormidium nitens]|eukprot:GAQ78634.1 hypothetical protein KFL_000160370 [Klebsormidium nitens]
MLAKQQACGGQDSSGDLLVGPVEQRACGDALLWGGCIMAASDERVGRLRGGAPEANSSGQDDPPDKESLSQNAEGGGEKEGSGGAESADPMEQDANERGEEEAKGEGAKGEEAPGDAKDKAEVQKKWNVECNGMQAEMLLVHNRCVFRCHCATCGALPPGERPEMSPNEFELHAGSRSKKWRTSIRAIMPEAQGGARIPLGKILEDNGLGRRQSNFEEGALGKGDTLTGDQARSGSKVRAKQKRTPPPPGRPPPDEPPSVRPMTSFPDPYRPPANPSPEPPRLFGRTIFDQSTPNGGAVARPLDPPRNPPGDVGRTVSSGRVAVDVELVNLGRLVSRAGWWDERSIYPGGYRSAVSFYSTRDVTRKCLFFQEIMEHWDATVQPLPVFKVIAEDRPQTPFVGASPDECWAEIQALVNNGLRQLRQDHVFPAAVHKALPLAVADVSGVDMFGLTDPAIIRLVEALDPHHTCREYWLRRQGLNEVTSRPGGDAGAAVGLGRDERLLRSLFDKGSMEELQALARVFTTLGGTGGLERVYRAALDVLERRIS